MNSEDRIQNKLRLLIRRGGLTSEINPTFASYGK